jgi:hypothetical protein
VPPVIGKGAPVVVPPVPHPGDWYVSTSQMQRWFVQRPFV